MPIVFKRGGKLIVIGGDGIHGLIKDLTDISNITIVNQYEDSQLDELLTQPEWQQPCKNC